MSDSEERVIKAREAEWNVELDGQPGAPVQSEWRGTHQHICWPLVWERFLTIRKYGDGTITLTCAQGGRR